MMKPAHALTLSVFTLVVPVAGAQTARLHSLGTLAPRDLSSYAHGISSDGVYIVGGCISASEPAPFRMQACRWHFPLGGEPSAPIALSAPATQSDFGSLALGVSDDGERIVGSIGLVLEFFDGLAYTSWHAMYWWDISSPEPAADYIPELMEFTDISAAGNIACGTTRFPFFEPIPGDPVRWAGPGSTYEILGTLGGQGQAHAVSADGFTIIGESVGPVAVNTFIWTQETGLIQLPSTPSDIFHTGMGMSPDAHYVVGGINANASLWTELTGLVPIDTFPGHSFAYAVDVTADGSSVVGYNVTDGDTRVSDAFIWDSANGTRTLTQMLAEDYGVKTEGWHFRSATAISDNGRTIIGYGDSPSGRIEAFAIRIDDSECAADFNNDASVNSQDFFDFLTAFFENDPSADFNGDNVVNSQDFFDFLGAFFTGC